MLEKLGFQKRVEETLTVARIPRVMGSYQFVLGMILALYVGFPRLYQLRFVARRNCTDSFVTRSCKETAGDAKLAGRDRT